MVRAYAVKGKKRKKREVVDAREYDHQHEEEEEEEHRQQTHDTSNDKDEDEDVDPGEEAEEEGVQEQEEELPGIPIPNAPSNQKPKPGAIFVLEKASLEVAKVGKTYTILNADDHRHFLQKHKRNPADYRPDIVHQALLCILDSPLNKAGRVRALYVRTEKGILIEVKPSTLLPRTFKRFCGLMSQLLQKLSITASGKREKLLRVVKNPVTRYLPVNSRKIGLSYSSEKLVQLRDYVATSSDDADLVFVVGAMAHGKIDREYTDDYIAVSGYPLSAACCLSRICGALEQKWKIL